MPRRPEYGVYTDDQGNQWALLVDGDYIGDPDRGWGFAAGLSLPPLPRSWRPRSVAGIDSTGRIRSAIVPSVTAPLWTGAVTSFAFETADGGIDAATVIELRGERRFGQQPS
jgi:hypothetical protein